jgi:hypothetical protein
LWHLELVEKRDSRSDFLAQMPVQQDKDERDHDEKKKKEFHIPAKLRK